MGAVWSLLAALTFEAVLASAADCRPQGPCYSAAGIVNSASSQPGALAPYTFATIYGENLSYDTRGLTKEDLNGLNLPVKLAGVGVLVNGIQGLMLYVSPKQVNFIIPLAVSASEVKIQLTRVAEAGPEVRLTLQPCAPALFQQDQDTVVALRPDWSVITQASPASPGDIVILYAAGLGDTMPPVTYGEAPRNAAQIQRKGELRVLLDGTPLDGSLIDYVGVAPGFAALYQINLRLPEKAGKNPEIRIAIGDQVSPAGLRLPLEPATN